MIDAELSSNRESGIVKVFYTLKGFGFITRKTGRDVFFHYKDIVTAGSDGSLLEGDRVEFTVVVVAGKCRGRGVAKVG